MHTGAPGGFLSLGRLCGGVHISGAGVGLGSCCSSWERQMGVARRRARGFDSCVSRRRWVSWTLWVVLGLCVATWVYSCLSVSTDYINMSSELQKRRTSCKGWVTRVSNSMKDYLNTETHAVSAYRILWVYAGFWWYHGILLVHLQDSVGAFGAKWLTKWLHHAKAPPHRGVLLWEWGNKDVHLVTTFVFCHVSKCYFFQQEFHCENVSAKCRSLVQVTPIELDFEVIFM